MKTPKDHALFRAERDALAFLGLLSSLYLRFDPPISSPIGNQSQPTHFHGLNVHALVIDNADGEVLALEQNQTYGQLDLSNAKSPLIQRAHDINRTIGQKVENLHGQNVIDTLFFDHLAGDLQVAFQFFCGVTVGDLATKGAHNTANSRTLRDLKRMCNVPAAN